MELIQEKVDSPDTAVENGEVVAPRMTSIAMVVPAELLFGLKRVRGSGE